MAKPTYFSQYQQDVFLNKIIFGNKKNGFFVDIGAHDGVTISNSLFFEKFNGWEGVCVEPNPSVFAKLSANRKSTNVNACVGSGNKKVSFTQIEGDAEMLSGITENYHEKHLQRIDDNISATGGKRTEIEVDMVTLDSIGAVKNRKIDFISIDTEGNEFEILKSIDFQKLDVAALTIENNYRDERIKDYLKSVGFIWLHKLGDDEVFLNLKDLSVSIKLRLLGWKIKNFSLKKYRKERRRRRKLEQ